MITKFYKKILICEDDKELLKIYEEIFNKFGIQSLVATDISEAKKIVNNEEIKGTILDYNLGNFTGINIYEYLLEKNIKVPSILVTGNKNEEIIKIARQVGLEDIFFKPIDLMTLNLIIDKIMKW
ncbi:MAG TPA: response regulator [bacterium]|nr:response regulator [bacterium]HOL47912.1 response regulator [bacterium]HPQ19227.1 response regulator [bacterium]